jgi:hypothetical protein
MRPVQTIPGVGGGGISENDGKGDFNYVYLICCKNFCKCYSVPQYNNKKNEKKCCRELIIQLFNNIWEIPNHYKSY